MHNPPKVPLPTYMCSNGLKWLLLRLLTLCSTGLVSSELKYLDTLFMVAVEVVDLVEEVGEELVAALQHAQGVQGLRLLQSIIDQSINQ